MENFKERFETLLRKKLGLKSGELKPEARFDKDLGFGLRDLVIVVIEMENEFEVDVLDDELEKIRTVGDCIAVFENLIKRKDSLTSTSHGKLQRKV